MVKKRLIFILYYFEGNFYLSRNFVLQKVGNVKWLMDKFRFLNIADYVDELVIFNVDRNRDTFQSDNLFKDLEILFQKVFVPFSIGGGLNTIEAVNNCFRFGCDKVVFNTAFFDNRSLVDYTLTTFGKQAVVINIDYKIVGEKRETYVYNADKKCTSLEEHFSDVIEYDPGEIILNCITLDGTGMGFDVDMLSKIGEPKQPIIIAGGAGKPENFAHILSYPQINAAATGNLFNFLGSGFKDVRTTLINSGLNVRKFSIQ